MSDSDQMTLTFRCPLGLEKMIPRPIAAVVGLPDWFKTLSPKSFNATMGEETQTVKKCPPDIDAMTEGYLSPRAFDLKVQDGEFSWDYEPPVGLATEYPNSPVGFHDPSQVVGTPLFEDDRFIVKFNNFWTIETPPGYSLLCTHPVNRTDLPFTTLTGLVDCDIFHDSPLNFPARWHDINFNGVLPKGTPVAQCLPVKRESWRARVATLSAEETTRIVKTRDALAREPDVYRHRFRAPKR